MQENQEKETVRIIVSTSRYLILLTTILLLCIYLFAFTTFFTIVLDGSPPLSNFNNPLPKAMAVVPSALPLFTISNAWIAPNADDIPKDKTGEMIRYGKELIVSTARYLGPNGTVAHLTNGMNCQNCHLDAGTKLFSNNFAGFISGYPKFSARSGKIVPASERIAECFARSLNGKIPDTSKKEVQAILAYLKWIGKDVKPNQKISGTATEKLVYLDRPADAEKGNVVYITKCQRCHGLHGEGILATDKKVYTYPPLWGADSYNDGAGMYRLTNFAGFVKNNMPFGATYQNPQLTDEEAWDVAAFVNSQPRPHKDQSRDYPDLFNKPLDSPFGPFADKFNAHQHKFGPFGPIKMVQKANKDKHLNN